MPRARLIFVAAVVGALQQPPMQHRRLTPRASNRCTHGRRRQRLRPRRSSFSRAQPRRADQGREGAGRPCLSNGSYLRRLINRSAPRERARVSGIRDAAVQLATPLLLLDADPRALVATSKPYVKAFAVAVVGTHSVRRLLARGSYCRRSRRLWAAPTPSGPSHRSPRRTSAEGSTSAPSRRR